MSREQLLRARTVCIVHEQHGICTRQPHVSVQCRLHRHRWRMPGLSGGHLQAHGRDVAVQELSGEQQVGQCQCAVCVQPRVHCKDRRRVRRVRRREVQEHDRIGGVHVLRRQPELYRCVHERDGVCMQHRIHTGRKRSADVRRCIRAGVCVVRHRQVQAADRRARMYYMCSKPVFCLSKYNLLVRRWIHRAGRGALLRMRSRQVQGLARLAGVHDVSREFVYSSDWQCTSDQLHLQHGVHWPEWWSLYRMCRRHVQKRYGYESMSHLQCKLVFKQQPCIDILYRVYSV